MLKGISNILSPELLKIMMEMGHGDEIVFADGNFPAASHAQRLVRADGHDMVPLLHAALSLFPLDTYVEHPVSVMQVVEKDGARPPIWNEYDALLKQYHDRPCELFEIERFAFYERAKQAYAVVATGESALYANLILKKGVITSS